MNNSGAQKQAGMRPSLGLWSRLLAVMRAFSFRQFDVDTSEGRARERQRRVAISVVSAGVARAVGLFVMLVTVPLAMKYLGSERYGMWMTMTSVVAMLGFADLGLSNGLLNAISTANGSDDRAEARRAVASTLQILAVVSCGAVIAIGILGPLLPWDRVFNATTSVAQRESGPAMLVLLLCFAATLPFGAVQQVHLGYQEGWIANIWQAVGSLLGLVGVVLAIRGEASLLWLVLAVAGGPLVATVLNAATLFGRQRPWLWPGRGDVVPEVRRKLLRTGGLFVALQLAGALGYQSDKIVLAQLLGPTEVTEYSIVARLFSVSPMILALVLVPLWPAYGEAIRRGDIPWVRRTFMRSILLGFVINGTAAVVLLLEGREIVRLWVGRGVTPAAGLFLAWSIWLLLNSLGGPIATLLNAANVIGFQVICAVLMGVANLGLSIFLVKRVGVTGVVYGTIVAQVLFVFLPALLFIPRFLASLSASSRESEGV